MKIVVIFLLVTAALTFFGWLIIRSKKKVPNSFWTLVEGFWLLISLTSALYALNQFAQLEERYKFQDREHAVKDHFIDVRGYVYGQFMLVDVDSGTVAQRETSRWFSKVIEVMDEGIDGKRWGGFKYYTKAYVFNERGYFNMDHNNAQQFNWPVNVNLKASQLLHKDLMRDILNKLDAVEEEKLELDRTKVEYREDPFIKYLIAFLFCLGLALKLLKLRNDHLRSIPQPAPSEPSVPEEQQE